MKINLLNLAPRDAASALSSFVAECGEPSYRVNQVVHRLWRKPSATFDEISDLPLVFRAWSPGDAMGKVQWGIAEPLPDKPVLEPDVALVPLLAFDAAGHRLGYGGGFYDRTLARLRAIKPVVAVGIAYDELCDSMIRLAFRRRRDTGSWVAAALF